MRLNGQYLASPRRKVSEIEGTIRSFSFARMLWCRPLYTLLLCRIRCGVNTSDSYACKWLVLLGAALYVRSNAPNQL